MKYLNYILLPVCLIVGFSLVAQSDLDSLYSDTDSLPLTEDHGFRLLELDKVIIIANPFAGSMDKSKALGSLDSYLEESGAVNMVRRGAYAWEPLINGMPTERSVITIDGMRIFQACTDKMDPITSYVETTNLSSAEVAEGAMGTEIGNTIAGSINLKRSRSGFDREKNLSGAVLAGFESNNKQQIYGTGLNYSRKKIFADIDFTYRNAENYNAGHKSGQSKEVEFSQFTKYNFSAITGARITDNQELEASVIYDKATDIGYPGLPMDVSLAEALITSVQYRYRNISDIVNLWETKVYYNTITHIMDDSHRPIVPIRMDMPGWSETAGFYSTLIGNSGQHILKGTLSGYWNNSLAEMTMYPDNPQEKEMFMLTWPDVNTFEGNFHLKDKYQINSHLNLEMHLGASLYHNTIGSEMGLTSLQLYYPELTASNTRFLKTISSDLSYHHADFTHRVVAGYSERAPSVSEAYGFYLLNINDNYDYIGNPFMSNEKSINLMYSASYDTDKISLGGKVNYFHIIDYILGKPRAGIPPMNMTANGIKVYEQLSYATILNTELKADYKISRHWNARTTLSYRYGQGADKTILPLIQPLAYDIKLRYHTQQFFIEAEMEGNGKNRPSEEYGETLKDAFTVFNLAASHVFSFQQQEIILKIGVENIFDKYYTSFDSWHNIPRMGRNLYVNAIYKF